jgi:hypothetical protein
VTDSEQRRTRLQTNCQVMRKLLARNEQLGNFPVLQDIGAIERKVQETPEEEFRGVVERYGVVFAKLRYKKVITPEIYEEHFARD